MVILHLKQNEDIQFLYNTFVSVQISHIVNEITQIYFLCQKIETITQYLEDLAKYGPYKTDLSLSIDEELKSDPSLLRIGQPPSENAILCLKRTSSEAKSCISLSQVEHKVSLTIEMLKEQLQLIEGSVMIAYPMGLPNNDIIVKCLNQTQKNNNLKIKFYPEDSCLWWANKRLDPSQTLQKYIGTNEKTKIVVKLSEKSSCPPFRENPIDSQTLQNMNSFYYKQQKELAEIAEDDEMNYLNSKWADPSALKRSFQGFDDNIKYK